jgi:TatD DNase family protein
MLLVDTHTHLFLEQFDQDRNEVVERALENDVRYLLLPNVDMSTIEPMMALTAAYPHNCFPMMGLHPGSVDQNWETELDIIRKHLFKNEQFIAVGEIGMDLYWDKTYLEQQRIVFRKQVEWAKELGLPIVIHAREAFEEIFAIIDELNGPDLKGVFHCFTGNVNQAHHILSYGGFKLGIGGVLTYKKSGLDEVLSQLSPEHLVLETDSPYLPPVPHRGHRNESSYVRIVAQKVSEIYNLSIAEVASITTMNALNLFDRLPSVNEGHHLIKGRT